MISKRQVCYEHTELRIYKSENNEFCHAINNILHLHYKLQEVTKMRAFHGHLNKSSLQNTVILSIK